MLRQAGNRWAILFSQPQGSASHCLTYAQDGLNICTLDTTTTYVDELPANNVDSYVRRDINLGTQLSKSLHVNITGQNLTDRSIFAKLI